MIIYYNKIKGGVDTMDKMLSEYTVKRRTKRWPLAFFYNMIDVAAVAACIINVEHNQNHKTTNQQRKFLKDLANQLCMPSIKIRALNSQIIKCHFTRAAIESCLGQQRTVAVSDLSQLRRDAAGHAVVVGSCYICRELKYKQRKTRKVCKVCIKLICDEHSTTKPTCNHCLEEQVFL